MTAQPFRLESGGLIDRSAPLGFTFNGRRCEGYAGDTLASALLANGVHLVARSFKYHRPRGIVGGGAEEPSALVQLGHGAATLPNTRATQIELYEGLAAASQNCWPSLGFDIGSVTGLFARLMPAGFYYKTFMWPRSLWMAYERVIRRVAGMGTSPLEPDPDHYEHRYARCDVLVAGGGPAGLAAALAAGRSGARVILADEGFEFGGSLLAERAGIGGVPALDWVRATVAELASLPEVTLLPRSTVFGYFDHNFLAIAERVLPRSPHVPRERIWKVRAKQVVLATGAIERPLVFADNDRPGVMLASAARVYANRYAVLPGRAAVIFTNNDTAYATALDLAACGVEVRAVIDARPATEGTLPQQVRARGMPVLHGHVVTRALGGQRVSGAEVARLEAGEYAGPRAATFECDLLCVSGGWNPTVHLFSQSKGKLAYDERLATFVPSKSAQAECSAGAARGTFALAGCLAEGLAAGARAAHLAGFGDGTPLPAPVATVLAETPLKPLWVIDGEALRREKCFVDLHNDVTAADVALAAREGYSSVEHLKRYTTLGMGTDQGKTSNVNGFAILAEVLGADISEIGTTMFRPPYAPVTLGALAGTEVGAHFDPVRLSPMHEWHERAGARFMNAGLWKRPQVYPRAGESELDAINREALAVRSSVGLVDVSTLGKIDIKGRDAAEFLERVYVNSWKTLAVGRVRYGIMLREDGMVFDDGTTTRLGETHFLMTTTTANAAKVMSSLEYLLQVEWPELEVFLTSVTEQWAAMAIAGPHARKVLETLASDIDFSNAALPYMGYRAGTIAGIPARVFRISFSGELAYEVNVPSDHGLAMWETLMRAGEPFGITAYGTEAMGVLRIEKGHFVGNEADGRTTPDDLGLGRMVSPHKDCIGKRSLKRKALAASGRKQLVGLVAVDGKTMIPRGAQLVADPQHPLPNPILGHVTSTCFSPTLGEPVALALLAAGRSRHDETLHAVSPLSGVTLQVKITGNVFVDPEGRRLRV